MSIVGQLYVERTASICHEANRAIQIISGEEQSPPWDDAPEWQRSSAIKGVIAAIGGLNSIQLHSSWMQEKVADGWVYGEVKDAEAKTHPCMVPYYDLPADQRLKDRVFGAIVKAVKDHAEDEGVPFP